MFRQVQTENDYVQTVPDSKRLCPDRPRRKVDMSRLSCVQNFSCVLRAFEDNYVQTIPNRNSICPDFRAFLSRPSCAPTKIRAFNAKFLVRPCPDLRAVMSRPSCVQVQTIVRSCPDFRAFTRPKKITSWGAVLFLEDQDRESSKIPQIHMFKVLSKNLILNHFFYKIEGRTDPSYLGF